MVREARLVLGLMIAGLTAGRAAPPLTTIQDVLYKADGTPFNGMLLIEWKSFDASDASAIATQSVTVPITNGVLRAQLVPTTTAAAGTYYRVRYSSDGRIQFEETWAVPPSSAPVKLRDVRVASPQQGAITPPPADTQIRESDVVGLSADLAIRPVKGAGYAPNRAAFIDSSGALEAVIGNLSDCVRVDGTSGPCGTAGGGGGSGPGFVDGETPAGLINGANAVFTTSNAASPPASLAVYRNGVLQKAGLDYTLNGNTIAFAAASIPQAGDVLMASYRLADASNPVGAAGGVLMGAYPNPQLALGAISNANVSDVAGIQESKLALNYPTHTGANDPTADQKAALAGTAGAPSAVNRFVSDQDPRMSNARTPAGHGLLGASHSDAAASAPARGDLIVGQGTSPAQWTRLPIGPANRCLMSNGFDAVWNACLYTGFNAGAIPFADANGNLAQNSGQLTWDNGNRKLSIGNNVGAATVYVYDALAASGSTTLTVRAGQGQGSDALGRWLDSSGGELARVDGQGRFAAASYRGATSSTRAAWQDAGSAADPATRSDGDAWYNTAGQARKTAEGGQVHTTPQVVCSAAGTSTTATALTRLGSCTIPADFLKPGDRVEVRFDYSHEGSGATFWFEVRWGSSVLVSRSGAAAEAAVTGRGEVGIHAAGGQWSSLSWGAATTLAAGAGSSAEPPGVPLTVDLLGRMTAATVETVTVRHFSVVRYPAQQNP
jgi:hypothetical protein